MELGVTVQTFWWLVLGLALVIVLVVAALLIWIILSLRRVEKAAGDIWIAGKAIAANTVHIVHLADTNKTAKAILAVANDIAAGAGSIDARLAKLPSVLGKG